MAATARAGAKTPSVSKRRPPAARPRPQQPDDDEIISIEAPPEDAPEPERVPIFEIGGTVYSMLKEPPPTLGVAAVDVSDRRGGGYGEVYLLREMMGSDALNALIDAGKKHWLTRAQYEAITRRVVAVALGRREDDIPNR